MLKIERFGDFFPFLDLDTILKIMLSNYEVSRKLFGIRILSLFSNLLPPTLPWMYENGGQHVGGRAGEKITCS